MLSWFHVHPGEESGAVSRCSSSALLILSRHPSGVAIGRGSGDKQLDSMFFKSMLQVLPTMTSRASTSPSLHRAMYFPFTFVVTVLVKFVNDFSFNLDKVLLRSILPLCKWSLNKVMNPLVPFSWDAGRSLQTSREAMTPDDKWLRSLGSVSGSLRNGLYWLWFP